MRDFKLERYEVVSGKCRSEAVMFHVLSDLHGVTFGEDNELLLRRILQRNPDAVLIPGDMVVKGHRETYGRALRFLRQLAGELPVYYSPGNHETYMGYHQEECPSYEEYQEAVRDTGAVFLANQKGYLKVRGTGFIFHGLELEKVFYHKPNSPELTMEHMNALIGKPWEEGYHVLLAHTPKYGDTYLRWGADLTVSGHYHGGILRLSKRQGMISPQFRLLPEYCCGDFERDGRKLIVSAGIGEHTIPVRICNPRVLVEICLHPLYKK